MKNFVLTDKNRKEFEGHLKSQTPILMLYHAEWCGHCQAFQPAWKDIKKTLSKEKGILPAEVEHTFMTSLPASVANISGFPTILVLLKGKPIAEYQGDRSVADVLRFAKKHFTSNPPAAAPKKKPAAPKLKNKK